MKSATDKATVSRPSAGCCLLGLFTAALIAMPLHAGPPATVTWFDNFNDGDAEDGMPLTWFPHPALPGDYNATSGDYVLTPGFGASNDDSMLSTVEPALNPGIPLFTDVSIRSRGVVGPDPMNPAIQGGNLILANRIDAGTVSGYVAYIDDGGQMAILPIFGGGEGDVFACYDPDDVLGDDCYQEHTGDPVTAATEVVFQLDSFGDTFTFSVWRPGDPQGTATVISGTDATFSEGSSGLVYNEDDDFTSGIFRWAKASTSLLVDGDMDNDLDVDFDDIDDFVLGLNDPAAYEATYGFPPLMRGDTDNDGDQDFDDISVFVSILTAGNQVASVPEPASWLLAALGLLGLSAARFVRCAKSRRG